ncbi:MAG: GGDEF domain-containing protein [Acholeplasmataceae bacterium]
MNLVYIIQVNVFAFAILLIILFGMQRKNEGMSVLKRIFKWIVLVNMLLIIFDFGVDLLSYFNYSHLVIPLIITGTLLFFFVPIAPFLWLLYVEYFIFKDLKRVRDWAKFFGIPIVINTIMVLINLFTPIIFSVSSEGIYQREPLFAVVASIAFSYIFLAIFHIMTYRKKIRRRDFLPMILFAMPVLIGGLVQTIVFGISSTWTSLAISVLLVYLFIQSKIIQTDYLTGLYNRREFDVKLSEMSKRDLRHMTFGLLMMDIDDFKHINDKYGHAMGDLALQAVSNVLRQNFRLDDFVARLGGDEFAAILELDKIKDIDLVIQRLNESLNIYNLNNHLPFELHISIGQGIFEGKKNQSLHEFVKMVDQRMYDEKYQKKSEPDVVNETGNHY